MLEDLKEILDIQELDMKMLRLMRVKKERLKEIAANRRPPQRTPPANCTDKETEIEELGKNIQALEQKIQEITAKIKKLESQQGSISRKRTSLTP